MILLVEHLEVVALDEVLRHRREAEEDEEVVVLLLLLLVEEEVDQRPQVLQRRLVHVGIIIALLASLLVLPPSRHRLVSAHGCILKEEDQGR